MFGPEITAALISGVVALIGGIISVRIARRELDAQAKIKNQELEAQANLKREELEAQARDKSRELDMMIAQLRVEQETQRQAQLTEILKKRIETYPTLYEIISVYGRNWEIEGKVRDIAWASEFLKALIENNAKNGAFFSNTVYYWYGDLRTFLEELKETLPTGREATDEEVSKLYDIIRGPINSSKGVRDPGLGSYIKNELGSYIKTIVSANYEFPGTHKEP